MDGELREGISYLDRKFPGWAQDKRLNSACAAAICRLRLKQPLHNRDQERKCFSCTGLRCGDHIGAGESRGDRLRLYRGGLNEGVPREILRDWVR